MRNALGCLGLLALCVSVFWLPKAFSPEPFAFRWALPCIASVALAFYGATGPKVKPKPQDRMSTLAFFALLSGLMIFFGFHFVNMFINPRAEPTNSPISRTGAEGDFLGWAFCLRCGL
jgi:drug/metabolite transporter (DMT)-like permease